MIWDPNRTTETADSPIVSHITAEIDAVCGSDMLGSPQNIIEIARAVDIFLKKEHDSASVDSRYVVMLASRALSSVGEGEAARRLLVFGTGLVRPSVWEVAGGKSMWVLDLKQITMQDDSSLDLFFFGCLSIVLDSIADIWDETGGTGVLGLRHVCSAAAGLLGKRGNKKAVADLASHIRLVCRKKLERTGGARGWAATPDVMNLDF